MEVVKILHMAAGKAGLEDEEYRLVLRSAAGVGSSKEVRTKAQYEAIRAAFGKLGVEIPAWHGRSATHRMRNSPQMAKAYALWCSLHEEGKVEDRSWKAMQAFIRRMFGQDILTAPQRSQLIEMLKQWEAREA